jgi:hypothetical protein
MIYYGTTFTATLTALRWKAVTCDHCAAEWAFLMKVNARGWSHTPFGIDRENAAGYAREQAEKDFQKVLATTVPESACPRCGYYQAGRVKSLRARRYEWLAHVGVVALIVGGFVALCVAVAFSLDARGAANALGASAALLIGGGVIAFMQRRRLEREYEPNADAATRRGRERACEPSVMMRDRYEQTMEEQRAAGKPVPPPIEWPARR